MTTRTLFEISSDLQALDDLLSDIGGEVTDEETETAIDTWLAELGAERDNKLNNYAYLIKATEGAVDALDTEITRLRDRKKTYENKIAKLKERLKLYMESNGLDKITTGLFTFGVQKSGGKPKVILNEYLSLHPEELPEGLRRVKFEADLEAIRAKLEQGDATVAEYAYLQESGRHLRIR